MYPLPPHPRTGRPHIQSEAFCLMKYQDEDGNAELIWNSRDGVTPFCITGKSGKEARHVEWQRDQYLPNFVPEVGSRIFADLTPQRARESAGRQFDRWTADAKQCEEIIERYGDRDNFVAHIALANLESFWPNSPDVIEVTEEIRAQFVRAPFEPRRFA